MSPTTPASNFWVLDWLSKLFSMPSSWVSPSAAHMAASNNSFPVFGPPSADSTISDPSRAADLYFPSSRRSSFSSNTSSVVAEPGTLRRPEPPALHHTQLPRTATAAGAAAPSRKVDALSRHFPKPTHEPSLEEMLARPPQKWSVGHYVKNARETKAPVRDKDEQSKAFAEAKRELLAAKRAMESSSFGPR